MQSQDIISVNIWQIVISLCNLTILYLIIRKLLYKPVQKMMAEREAMTNAEYQKAESARAAAEQSEAQWNEKMKSADMQAEQIMKSASENAKLLSERIEAEAKDRAEHIVNAAHESAELEYKRAHDSIRTEIADVSAVIAEKVIGREIDEKTHHDLINSFLDDITDGGDV